MPGIVEVTKSTSIKITPTQERTGGATVGPELETHKNKETSFPQGEGHFREKSLTPTKIFSCFNEIVTKNKPSHKYMSKDGVRSWRAVANCAKVNANEQKQDLN